MTRKTITKGLPTLAMGLLVLGCDMAKEKAGELVQEKALEIATGGKAKVDIQGEKVTIQTPEGTATIDPQSGKTVVTNEKGEVSKLEMKEGSLHIESDKGTVDLTTNVDAKELPLPLVDGAEVKQHVKADDSAAKTKVRHVIIAVKKPVKDVGAFYEKALKDAGLEVTKVEQTAGADSMVILTGKKPKVEAAVHVVSGGEAPGETTATIHWSEGQ